MIFNHEFQSSHFYNNLTINPIMNISIFPSGPSMHIPTLQNLYNKDSANNMKCVRVYMKNCMCVCQHTRDVFIY